MTLIALEEHVLPADLVDQVRPTATRSRTATNKPERDVRPLVRGTSGWLAAQHLIEDRRVLDTNRAVRRWTTRPGTT